MGVKKIVKKSYKKIKSWIKKRYARVYCLRLYRSAIKKYPLFGTEDFSIDLTEYDEARKKILSVIAGYPEEEKNCSVNDLYFRSKVQEKTVLILGLGHNVRGNMRYILDELNTADDFEGFRFYVRTNADSDQIVRDFISENNWVRTETCKKNKDYDRLLETAQFLLTETFFPESWVKKPEQIYINIWHGTPLKKLGLAKQFRTSHRNGVTQKNFMNADYLLYPNQYTRKNMLDSYKVSALMHGKILMLGYPRTGGMLSAAVNLSERTRNILAPNGEKLYVYMPTFRDYLSTEECVQQSKELLDYLEDSMRDDQILYVNLHHRLSDSIDYSLYKKIRQFPRDMDSYQIMAASDALISDYSSVFFDYLALRKQIILYINDYKKYSKKRGMYMDILKLPFDKAKTKEAVLEALNRGKTYNDDAVYKKFCSYDSAENAKKLCRLIRDGEGAPDLELLPRRNCPAVYIYDEAMNESAETTLLCSFANRHDSSKSLLYLGCDSTSVDGNRDYAYPTFFEVPVMGTDNKPYLTALGEYVKSLYLNDQITFETAIEYLKYDYALLSKRIFASAQFNYVVIYDSCNPENIIALAQADAPKLLFLQEHMINTDDKFMKDAVCWAAEYSRNVCVISEDMREKAKEFLGDHWKHEIFVIDSEEKMETVIFGRIG